MKTCPRCNGTGKTKVMTTVVKCIWCNGTGKIKEESNGK